MKKEVFASILLALMLCFSVLNSVCIGKTIDGLSRSSARISELCSSGEWDSALGLTEGMISDWERRGWYLQTVLKHSDLNDVTEDFFELKSAVREKDTARAVTLCEHIESRLRSIRSLESIRLGSIF